MNLYPPDARAAHRDALGVDDAEWERGKGWVLTGVFGVLSYREPNPVLAADKRRGIEAVLGRSRSVSDQGSSARSDSTVSASDADLSGRYPLIRAKRSTTPAP